MPKSTNYLVVSNSELKKIKKLRLAALKKYREGKTININDLCAQLIKFNNFEVFII